MKNPLRSIKIDKERTGALRIAALYFLIASLWIVFSDQLAGALFPDTQRLILVNTIKGWFFVLVTSVLLFIVIRREMLRLHASREKLRADRLHDQLIARGANDGYWELDPDQNTVMYSSRALTMLGYQEGEIDTSLEAWKQLVHSDDLNSVMSNLDDLLSGRADHFEQELRMHHHAGHDLDILFKVSVFRPDDHLFHLVGTQTDITAQKQAEQALKRFEMIFEHSRDSIFFLRAEDGQILEANQAALAAYGYSRAEMMQLDVHAFRGEQDSSLVHEQMEMANTEGILFEAQHRRKDGSFFPVEVSSRGAELNGTRVLVSVVRDISERKRADEALRSSERTLQLFVDYAPAAIAMFNREMRYIAASRRFLTDYRIPEQTQLIGHSHYEIFPEISERWKEIHQRCQNGAVESCDADPFPRGDGSVDWVRWEIRPWYQESGDQGGIVLFSEVITDRIQAQKTIEDNERKLRTLFEVLPVGISILNADRKMLYNNPALNKNLEMEESELSQAGYLRRKYIHADGSPMQANEFASVRAVEEQQPVNDVETGIIKENGQTLWLSVSAVPVSVGDWRVIVVNSNITDRKRAEARLRQSEERFAKAFRSSPAAIALIGPGEGRIVEVNESFLNMFGYDHEELIGQRSADLNLYPDPEARNQLTQIMRENGYLRDFELKTQTKTGNELYILLSAERIQLESEEHVILIMYNITQRKQYEEELKRYAAELTRSNSELEQFAYVASHDLQEPLRAVAGMVQLLQQRYQGKLDERADEYIDHAVAAASRMQGLINDLLAFSRVDRRGKPFEWTDADSIFQVSLANLAVVIKESDALITHDPLPTVWVDSTQLGQVFQNLLANAIKFCGEKRPEIHVGVQEVADEWQFSVRDNGIGIEEQYFERIFAVFQRLHTRREYPGTGIGLAICKKIIERHGGKIWVNSQPGMGSIFYFTIPVRRKLDGR